MEVKALVHKPVIPRLSPEQQVLLGAIRVDGAQDERLREILARGLDWPLLRQMALSHEVLPLLYTRMKALGEGLLPTDELEQLRALYLANVHRTLRLAQKLLRALDLLAGRGIEALPFKGPALAVQAYDELPLRQFIDLDILIHPQDLRPAYDLLVAAGYRPLFPPGGGIAGRLARADYAPSASDRVPPMDARQLSYWLRRLNHLAFSDQASTLEVHWAVAPRFLALTLEPECFWRGLRAARLNGREIRLLSPENSALVLCLHGARHRWYQLKEIADLAQLMRRCPELDWPALFDRGKELGIRRILCLALQLAEEVGGASLPAEIRVPVRADAQVRGLACQARGWLFEGSGPGGARDLMDRLLFDLRCRERFQDRLYYLYDRVLAFALGV